jgi:hypothetical protein
VVNGCEPPLVCQTNCATWGVSGVLAAARGVVLAASSGALTEVSGRAPPTATTVVPVLT